MLHLCNKSADEIYQIYREQMNDLLIVHETQEEDKEDEEEEDDLATIHLKNGHTVSPNQAENYLDMLRKHLKKATTAGEKKEIAYEIEQLECQLGYSL